MILYIEAEFTDLDFFTNHALVFRFIYQLSFATRTLETSIVLGQSLNTFSTSCCTANQMANSFTTVILFHIFFLFLLKPLAIFIYNIKSLRSPVRTTKWTLEWFTVRLVVFETPFKTV